MPNPCQSTSISRRSVPICLSTGLAPGGSVIARCPLLQIPCRPTIMAFWAYPGGHDMQTSINLDSLSQSFVACAASMDGPVAVRYRRQSEAAPCCAYAFCHWEYLLFCTLRVYWCIHMLAYVLNGFFCLLHGILGNEHVYTHQDCPLSSKQHAAAIHCRLTATNC